MKRFVLFAVVALLIVSVIPFSALGEGENYNITYCPGANADGMIPADVKNNGTALILSSETFSRDGFEQTGWALSEGGPVMYALGGSYTEDAPAVLYPVWNLRNPHTGDDAPLFVYMAMTAVSLMAVSVLVYCKKKVSA